MIPKSKVISLNYYFAKITSNNFYLNQILYIGNKSIPSKVIKIDLQYTEVLVYGFVNVGDEIFLSSQSSLCYAYPGIVGKIFDGLQQDLSSFPEFMGDHSQKQKYNTFKFYPIVPINHQISYLGEKLGYVIENSSFKHYYMVTDPLLIGKIITSFSDYVTGPGQIMVVDKSFPIYFFIPLSIALFDSFSEVIDPISPTKVIPTGLRIIDLFYPIIEGTTTGIIGDYGTGKTSLLFHFFKTLSFDLIVITACGERGNEVSQFLYESREFMKQSNSIFFVNVSNMLVQARENSVINSSLISKYFSLMGYSVGLLCDSLSRWGESLKEACGIRCTKTSEEGYPYDLSSQLSSFFNILVSVKHKITSVIGSITSFLIFSPMGGDIQEYFVKESLLRLRSVLLLDSSLREKRHFPAINWTQSYSKNNFILSKLSDTKDIFSEKIIPFFNSLLINHSQIEGILKILPYEELPDKQKLIYDVGEIVISGFFKQNFDPNNILFSIKQSQKYLKLIYDYYYFYIESPYSERPKKFYDLIKMPLRDFENNYYNYKK